MDNQCKYMTSCKYAGFSSKLISIRSAHIGWLGSAIEPMLICVERSQLRWQGNLFVMPLTHLPFEVFWHIQLGGDPSIN